MTFRIRDVQAGTLARSHVGRYLSGVLSQTGKASWYDEREHCVRVTGYRDQCTSVYVGEHGRIERLVSPLGRQTVYSYEGSRQVGAWVPSGLQLATSYDSLGRVTRSERSDGEAHHLGYDAQGNLASFAAADAVPVRLVYDEKQRVRRVIERDGAELRYDYDELDRLSSVSDPLDRVTHMKYGLGGTPERHETPDGNVLEYRYEAALVHERVNDEDHAEYASDAEGRIVGGKYADGYEWSFEYDDAGRLISAKSSEAEVKYEYDDVGRLVAEDQAGNVVRYRYSEDGQLAELTLPDGRSVGYAYDLDGRVESVRDWIGGTQHFQYGGADHPLRRELPNGLVESYALDVAGRLTGINVHDHVQTFWSQQVLRDTLGRVATQHDSRSGARQCEYDAVGRLSHVVDASGAVTEAFAYDRTSQRVLGPGGPTSYDEMCRPLRTPGSSFAYDGLGNRARTDDQQGETLFSWTGPNLLSRVKLPDGTVVRYAYDAHGRRIRKVTAEGQVTYIWAGNLLVQEILERDGERIGIDYLYLPGSFRPLAKCQGGEVYYYHCDHLGTPQHLSDRSAQLMWSATYSAFGEASTTVSTVEQPLRFPGQYFDIETGLHYNRARYYDPSLGVYLSRDPLGPLGENSYLYARGNPVDGVDPLGLFWESAPGWVKTTATIAAGVAVGVAVGALVVVAAPLLGASAVVAGVAAIIVGGIAGGAAAGGLDAAMTEGGCVLCGMAKGAVIGGLAAIPFAFLPAGAGYLAFAGVGAVSGAVGYFADLAISGGEFSWGDLGISMAAGTVFGVAGKWVGGAIGRALGRRGGTSGRGAGAGAADERPTLPDGPAEPPAVKPGQRPPPRTENKYEPIEMTEFGKRWDNSHNVQKFSPEQLESHRVVAGDDGSLIYAESGKPVDCENGIYTMDQAGNTYVIEKPVVGDTHHSTMLDQPSGAGEISATNGRLTKLNENTGHFGDNQPPGTVNTVADELAQQGVDTSQADIKSWGSP